MQDGADNGEILTGETERKKKRNKHEQTPSLLPETRKYQVSAIW